MGNNVGSWTLRVIISAGAMALGVTGCAAEAGTDDNGHESTWMELDGLPPPPPEISLDSPAPNELAGSHWVDGVREPYNGFYVWGDDFTYPGNLFVGAWDAEAGMWLSYRFWATNPGGDFNLSLFQVCGEWGYIYVWDYKAHQWTWSGWKDFTCGV